MSTATLLAALSTELDGWYDRGDWYDQGACVQDGADLFFARQDELDDDGRETAAKARCVSCPVLADCRAWALAAGDPSGVWAGGTNTTERMALPGEYGIAA